MFRQYIDYRFLSHGKWFTEISISECFLLKLGEQKNIVLYLQFPCRRCSGINCIFSFSIPIFTTFRSCCSLTIFRSVRNWMLVIRLFSSVYSFSAVGIIQRRRTHRPFFRCLLTGILHVVWSVLFTLLTCDFCPFSTYINAIGPKILRVLSSSEVSSCRYEMIWSLRNMISGSLT